MLRRSQRLQKKMSENGKQDEAVNMPPEMAVSESSTDSDSDRTLIEQHNESESVAELRQEIRTLKLSL